MNYKAIAIITLFIIPSLFCVKASAGNYTEVMQQHIEKMYKAKTARELSAISGVFYRVAEKESDAWLPLYYSAYSLVRIAFFTKDREEIDKYLDMAQAYVTKLKEARPEESEVYVLQALLYSMRISGAMSGMKYSTLSNEELDQAEKLNKNNPRIYYCRGNNVFHTPSLFGGGKGKAKPLFEKAINLFESEQYETPFWPSWGHWHTKQMLEQCNN
ncbi:hypothetical protein [Saccharicrinis carchari]|nr:hypothetical protein [Saccharicrinis carchari]